MQELYTRGAITGVERPFVHHMGDQHCTLMQEAHLTSVRKVAKTCDALLIISAFRYSLLSTFIKYKLQSLLILILYFIFRESNKACHQGAQSQGPTTYKHGSMTAWRFGNMPVWQNYHKNHRMKAL